MGIPEMRIREFRDSAYSHWVIAIQFCVQRFISLASALVAGRTSYGYLVMNLSWRDCRFDLAQGPGGARCLGAWIKF